LLRGKAIGTTLYVVIDARYFASILECYEGTKLLPKNYRLRTINVGIRLYGLGSERGFTLLTSLLVARCGALLWPELGIKREYGQFQERKAK
jgi:hypothetical protein